MDCETARERLVDDLHGRLGAREHADLEAHMATCEACRHLREIEQVTDGLLGRIPRFAAPASLRREVRARRLASLRPQTVESPEPEVLFAPRPRRSRLSGFGTGALAAALVAAIAVMVARPRVPDPRAEASARLDAELVNDHLRLLYAEHPLDIESTGIHDVKPWFAGKLDFAPPVAFTGDADFPLKGGAVALVVDRKAADFVFTRRRHTISLFVTPSAGLAWPSGTEAMGRVRVRIEHLRGFSLVTWQDGELAYALVSDCDSKELLDLGARITGT